MFFTWKNTSRKVGVRYLSEGGEWLVSRENTPGKPIEWIDVNKYALSWETQKALAWEKITRNIERNEAAAWLNYSFDQIEWQPSWLKATDLEKIQLSPEKIEEKAKVTEEYNSTVNQRQETQKNLDSKYQVVYSQIYASMKDEIMQSGKSETGAWQIAGDFMKEYGPQVQEILSRNLPSEQRIAQIHILKQAFSYSRREKTEIASDDSSRDNSPSIIDTPPIDPTLANNLTELESAQKEHDVARENEEKAIQKYVEVVANPNLINDQREHVAIEQKDIPQDILHHIDHYVDKQYSQEWLSEDSTRVSEYISTIPRWESRWILFSDESWNPSPFIVATLSDGRHAIRSPEWSIYTFHSSNQLDIQKEIELIKILIATPILRRLVFMWTANFDNFKAKLTQKYNGKDMNNPDHFKKYAFTEIFQLLPDDGEKSINTSLKAKVAESGDPSHIDNLMRWMQSEWWQKTLESIRTWLREQWIMNPHPSREINPEVLFQKMR
jgi:hypothetical protein